jgi:DNA-binding GntR family transcriptional regulator
MNFKQRAYDFIREQIFDGTMLAGARVSDYTVAKAVGVSRTPVREAMTQLATEGFLEQVPKHGYFVKTLTRKELAELFDIRLLLEGYAVEKATDAITPKRLTDLNRLCDEMNGIIEEIRQQKSVTATDAVVRRQILNDVAFHLSIIRAAESPRLLRMVSDLRLLTQLFSYKHLDDWLNDPVSPLLETLDEHRAIVEAMDQRKPKLARERIEAHLELGKQRALHFFDQNQAEEEKEAGGFPLQVTKLIRQMESEEADEE